MKKNIQNKNYYLCKGWFTSAFFMDISDLIHPILPERAEEIKNLSTNAMNYFLNRDDDLKFTRTVADPYILGSTAPSIIFAKKTDAEAVQNAVEQLSDLVRMVEESKELDKYPAVKSLISFYGELAHRAAEGEDVADIFYKIPGGIWLHDLSVDFSDVMKNPEEAEKMLTAMNYPQMVKNAMDYYKLMQELENPEITPQQIKDAIPKMKELNEKINAQVDYLKKDEVAEKARGLFTSYDLNVIGNRGSEGLMRRPANQYTQALEQGWDPRYVADYNKLISIAQGLNDELEFLRSQNEPEVCNPLIEKIEAVIALDPTKQMFYSAEEFVGYGQKYSEALTATIEAAKNPRIQELFERPSQHTHPLKWEPDSSGFHGPIVDTLEFFADRMNFKKRGISVVDGVIAPDVYTVSKTRQEVAIVRGYIDRKMNDASALFERVNRSQLAEALKPYVEGVQLACELGAGVERIDGYLTNLVEGAETYEEHDPDLVRDIKAFANDMKNGFKNKEIVPDDFDLQTPLLEQKEEVDQILNDMDGYVDSFSATPRNVRLDYRFLSTVANNIGPQAGLLQFAKNKIDPKYYEEAYLMETAEVMMLQGYDMLGRDGEYRSNPYHVENQAGFNHQVMANTYEQHKMADRQMAMLKAHLTNLKNEAAFQDKKGIQTYLDMNLRLITDAEKGIDRGLYVSRIPGNYYLTSFPDWTSVQANPETSVEEFEEMLTNMGYADAWEHLSARVDLDIENDHVVLNEEQSRALKDRIKDLNNRLIADYEKMKAPANEKYAKFFQNYGLNVIGERGVDKRIAQLKEQNAMLDAGWDPTRIADYSMLQQMSETAEETQLKLAEINDPKLDNLREKMKKLSDLNPANQIFESQEKFDLYYARYSRAMCDVLSEGKSKEVKDILRAPGMANHKINGTLLQAFVSDAAIDSTSILAKMDAVFDNVNLPAQKLKGDAELVEQRMQNLQNYAYRVDLKELEKKDKTTELKLNLEAARAGLYKKHRIGFGGASKEMELVREKTDTLYRMITTEKRLIDDPKVVQTAKELKEATENYEQKKRAAAGALDNPDWKPKTSMGQVRLESNNQIHTIIGNSFVFGQEQYIQEWYGSELPKESYFGIQLADTQNKIINGPKEGPEVLKNIAKVIAIQTLAHKCMEEDMNIFQFPDSVLEDSTNKILKSPGFKKMISNPQDPSSDEFTKAIVNAAHSPGNLMADYYEGINKARQINQPENHAPQRGPVKNGPVN